MGHLLHVYFMSSNPEFSLSSAERISSFKVEVMARHVLCKWLNHAAVVPSCAAAVWAIPSWTRLQCKVKYHTVVSQGKEEGRSKEEGLGLQKADTNNCEGYFEQIQHGSVTLRAIGAGICPD